jgi:hypothetical protein
MNNYINCKWIKHFIEKPKTVRRDLKRKMRSNFDISKKHTLNICRLKVRFSIYLPL